MSIITENFTPFPNGSYQIVLSGRHSKHFVGRVLYYLARHPSTKVVFLMFHGCPLLSDAQSAALRMFLVKNVSLSCLSFSSCTYTYNTMMAVASAMRTNFALKELVVHYTPRFNRERDVLAAFTDALRERPRRPDRSRWCLFANLETEGELLNDLPLLLEESRK